MTARDALQWGAILGVLALPFAGFAWMLRAGAQELDDLGAALRGRGCTFAAWPEPRVAWRATCPIDGREVALEAVQLRGGLGPRKGSTTATVPADTGRGRLALNAGPAFAQPDSALLGWLAPDAAFLPRWDGAPPELAGRWTVYADGDAGARWLGPDAVRALLAVPADDPRPPAVDLGDGAVRAARPDVLVDADAALRLGGLARAFVP